MIFLKNCNGNTLKFDNVATLLALGKDTSWEVFGKPVATKTVTSFKESLQDLKKRCQTYIENIETTLEAVTDEEIREHKDIVKAYILSLSDEERKEFGLRTFQRGITDLIKHEFLAETMQTGVYFINPTFMYNGNRLAIVNEYIMKPKDKDLNLLE
jgi:hypothetical protein